MRTSFTASAILAITLLFESSSASCGHGTSLLKRNVGISKRAEGEAGGVKTVEIAKFGYISTQGPTGWAALAVENAGCATNKIQSPIDITATSAQLVAPGTLQMNFPTVESTEFENIGSTLEVVMEGKNASTTVNGKVFELKQFHFHTPSEHTIDGQYFPLEMHMVHEAADGTIAVIATHFQLSETGETTSLLTEATSKIAEITTPGSITETGPIDFSAFVTAINAQSMSLYTGSLTTPPCAEGLQFFVTTKQLPLNVTTFNKIKSVVGFNARFTQNTPGQENLLTASAKQVQGCDAVAVAPVVEKPVAEKPVAEKPVTEKPATVVTTAAPVQTPHVVVEEAPVAAPVHTTVAAPVHVPVAAPVHAPAAAPVHAPAASPVHVAPASNVHLVGNGPVTAEMAKLIKAQTGIDVAVTGRKSRKFKA